MKTRTAVALTAAALLALSACSSEDSDPKPPATSKPSPTASDPTPSEPGTSEPTTSAQPEEEQDAAEGAGIPKEPTGKERQDLLAALAQAAPDVVRYEDKAIDAARNQCSAITGKANKLDWLASQRFSYKDVTTSEAQGAKLNEALKTSGFCKV
ncbi:hypothetical protein [Streptomyces tauricus]